MPSANPCKRVGEFLEPSTHAGILSMLQDKTQAGLQQQHFLRAELRLLQLARILHPTTPIGRGDRIDPTKPLRLLACDSGMIGLRLHAGDMAKAIAAHRHVAKAWEWIAARAGRTTPTARHRARL